MQRYPSGLQRAWFFSGTFDRQIALADESQQFLSPGHPLVDALIEDLHTSAEGRASVMKMSLGPEYRNRWFALVLVRSDLNERQFAEIHVPNGLRLRARRFHIPELQFALVELHPGDEAAATIVTEANIIGQIRNPNNIRLAYSKIVPNTLGAIIDTWSLWAAVEEGVTLAVDHVRTQREGIAEEAASQLEADLRPEIGFLTWKITQRSQYEEDDLEDAIKARLCLIDSVRNEYLRVEALAVIVSAP